MYEALAEPHKAEAHKAEAALPLVVLRVSIQTIGDQQLRRDQLHLISTQVSGCDKYLQGPARCGPSLSILYLFIKYHIHVCIYIYK